MRSQFHAPLLRRLLCATSVVVSGGFLASCSNDATRIDQLLTAGTAQIGQPVGSQPLVQVSPATQPAYNPAPVITQPVRTATQSFPGQADTLTTASIAPQTSLRDRLRTIGISRNAKPSVPTPPVSLGSTVRTYAQGAATKIRSVAAPVIQPAGPVVAVSRQPLASVPRTMPSLNAVPTQPVRPAPAVTAQRTGTVYLPPARPVASAPIRTPAVDNVSTGSITAVAPRQVAQPSSSRGQGWSGAGGTQVTVRPGETLYNLSKRYGVPVDAIMAANSLASASDLAAGSRVLIPAYTYSDKAAVSAPDHDPLTKAAKASIGMVGQASPGAVAIPKYRANAPEPVAAAVPVATAQPPIRGATYVVQSGDTLYGLSRRLGVSVSQLRTNNDLQNDSLRIGQTLQLGAGATPQTSQQTAYKVPQPLPDANVDTRTTGSIPSRESAAKSIKPTGTVNIASRATEQVKTPSQTGSGAFRWPIRGRVITQFGQPVNGASSDGIDISVPEGTPIKATENGTVIYSGSELANFGNLILVSHSDGWVSAYAHASANKVKRGETVTRGQVIALSGRSGNATAPKLHFELRKNSKPVDPMKYLSAY